VESQPIAWFQIEKVSGEKLVMGPTAGNHRNGTVGF
jgi:hypothetical protein